MYQGNCNKWDTGTKQESATTCSYGEKVKKEFIISPEVYAVISSLCKEIEVEWQMLLKGKEVENKVYITGYYIPKQEVSYGSVKNIDCIDREFIEKNNIVAGIHSHANMQCFFSSTDEESTNSFLHNSIVVNNRLEFLGQSKTILPCGLLQNVDADINIAFPEVKIVGKDNIQEVVPNVTVYPPYVPQQNWNYGKKKDKRWKKMKGGGMILENEDSDMLSQYGY